MNIVKWIIFPWELEQYFDYCKMLLRRSFFPLSLCGGRSWLCGSLEAWDCDAEAETSAVNRAVLVAISTASIRLLLNPLLSNIASPSIVHPAGEQTSSFKDPGCLPVSKTIFAEPCHQSRKNNREQRPWFVIVCIQNISDRKHLKKVGLGEQSSSVA